jgi:hypothetical protein
LRGTGSLTILSPNAIPISGLVYEHPPPMMSADLWVACALEKSGDGNDELMITIFRLLQ